jgi:hypothetical protein
MLAKKLLTLACAAGILALGACFLPPAPVFRPPPPAPRIGLHGIRRICVTAANQAQSQHIDASYLAADIVRSIDERVDRHFLRASAACNPSDEGTLHVDLLSESAEPQPNPGSPATPRWWVAVTLNAALTARDGAVVWHAADFDMRFPYPLLAPDAATLWSTREIQIQHVIASQLTTRFLNGE